jgi:hypothetical protein
VATLARRITVESVPNDRDDRGRPSVGDDGLSDDDRECFAWAVARLLERAWDVDQERRRPGGVVPESQTTDDKIEADASPAPSPQSKQRTRRAKPSAIALWEAQWQAEHASEAES